MPELIDAASARELTRQLGNRLRVEGIAGFRAPPPEPTTCCARGCHGCVWEGYFAALGWWRDDALALLGQGRGA
ncbi:oxidoreductase-like domain-containing protein [Variovorax ureilyticus]|uniref:oxidoreductase-like domain-containing protein n=1 Tax=Variovorax ureilyticus TaxID=1836198 RepID=UPI003BF4F29A